MTDLHFLQLSWDTPANCYQGFVDVLKLEPGLLHHQVDQRGLSLVEVQFLILEHPKQICFQKIAFVNLKVHEVLLK